MATVPAIAMGVRGIELQDPLTQYSRVAAIQHAQQQNQLARMQLEQSERDTQLRNRLRAFVPTMTPENRNQLLGYGAEGRAVYESLLKGEKDQREAEKSQREAEKSQRETEKAQEEIAAKRLKLARDLLPAVTTPEQYAEWYQYTTTQLPGLAKMIPQQFSPDVKQMLMMEADKALEQHFVNQNLGGSTRVVAAPKYGQGPARVVEGTEAGVTMAPGEAERIKNEGLRIGIEGRRVAVLEENARRDNDPAFQQRMEAARTVGRKAAEGDVAAVQALPKVISRAEEGMRLIDELVGKRDSKTGALLDVETVDPRTGKTVKVKSKPHPGFQNAVGATWLPGARFIPGTDAAGFMSRFDQIKGASFLEAFESLKGGGAITEKEGHKGTDAINRMSTSTDEKEFIRAAMDLQDVIRKGVENAQKRAARAGGAAPAAPAAPAADGVKFLGFE